MPRVVIVVNGDGMGSGSEELGKTLIGAFLKKIWASDDKPETIVFYNAGVKLLAKGSAVLDALSALADLGVELLACGTCVNYFELKEQIQVGRISNMEEITSTFMKADSVITV